MFKVFHDSKTAVLSAEKKSVHTVQSIKALLKTMQEPTFTDLTDLAKRTRLPKRELVRIVRRLVKIFDPLRIYLFGSFSWGKPHHNSDLDFCVIVEQKNEPGSGWNRASKAFQGFDRKYVDWLYLSKEDFESMISNPATMEYKIYKDAEMLYTKPDLMFDENKPLIHVEHDWLDRARRNIIMSKRAIHHEEQLPEESLFHVQQCIEHTLRAFRAFHLQELIKTHEIHRLRKLCLQLDSDFLQIEGLTRSAAKRISEYYWLRYSNEKSKEVEIPDLPMIEQEIALAERIYEFVKHKIETIEPPTKPTIIEKP